MFGQLLSLLDKSKILKFSRNYVNCYTFFEEPGKDWLAILQNDESPPSEMMLFWNKGLLLKKYPQYRYGGTADRKLFA